MNDHRESLAARLARANGDGPYVSVYLHAESASANAHANRLRLRRLLDEAGQRLAGWQLDEQVERDLLAPAAELVAGRVETLVVARDEPAWGVVDEHSGGGLERHGERRPRSEDLLDVAARLATRRGADVHAVDARLLTGDTMLAARYRY